MSKKFLQAFLLITLNAGLLSVNEGASATECDDCSSQWFSCKGNCEKAIRDLPFPANTKEFIPCKTKCDNDRDACYAKFKCKS